MFCYFDKMQDLYKWYVLGLVSIGYIFAELGHYLIGTTSKVIAKDLEYGDNSCMLNLTHVSLDQLPIACEKVNSTELCASLMLNGTSYCEWGYNGLGIDYQVLAGPAFIAVYSVVGIVFGVLADKYNRTRTLSFCTLVIVIAIILMGSVTKYWHLVLLRMILAGGESACIPLATGILTDLFPEHQRAFALSIFNWGMYGGYGFAFPVGRYVPDLNVWGLNWRACYYGSSILGLIITVLTFLTLKEPSRTTTGEECKSSNKAIGSDVEVLNTIPQVTIWQIIVQPRFILLCLAASIRHSGGMAFAYNSDLFYRDYFPNVDLGWWLFSTTTVIGAFGVVVGGMISDRYVKKLGIQSRMLIAALSTLLATPAVFCCVIFGLPWTIVALALYYLFAVMWYGIVFTILVEIVPLSVRSTTVSVFLFIINNIEGNLPIVVDPVSKVIGYREALMIFCGGFFGLSSILFFISVFLIEGPKKKIEPQELKSKRSGIENIAFTPDQVYNRRPSGDLPIIITWKL